MEQSGAAAKKAARESISSGDLIEAAAATERKQFTNILKMFQDILMLKGLNETLLGDLQKNGVDHIGETFKKFAPYFQMYTAYLDKLDDTIHAIAMLLDKVSGTNERRDSDAKR